MGTAGEQNAELIEDVVQYNYNSMTNMTVDLGQMYMIGGPGLPLHPAAPLDIAISQHDALKAFVDQLASVADQGDATINGHTAHLIGGDWRQYADAPVSGVYQLAITDEGDLLRFILKEKVADAGLDANGSVIRTPVIDVTTTWNIDLKVNGTVDESLFKDRALNPPQPQPGATQGGGAKPPL
jgi:hypothetical protein